MSRWLVDKVGSLLESRTDRRGFLGQSAVVGSAMVVAPATYVLRPTSAYAAICSCNGSSCDCTKPCCDGYTEFCCTVFGQNKCPPGTKVAGWWKADGTSYCLDAGSPKPRYYVDCNSVCGSCAPDASGFCSPECSYACSCGCVGGSCNNRKACCTKFRYGQCNQAIPYLGPIICRVVTCNAPWLWEETCTTTSATDQNTASHNKACLQASDPYEKPPEPEPEPEPEGPTAAQYFLLTLAGGEEDTMKLVRSPEFLNVVYLLYPSGLMIDVSADAADFQDAGVEEISGLSASVFNRLVTVNEMVRELLGMNVTNIPKA